MRSPSFLIVVLAVAIGASAAAQSGEDLPRRQYESGLSFLKGQRYAEALKDFQAVIDSFPRSLVADNALLQIALYQIDVVHDLGAAQSAIDQLLKSYPDTDSAPMAYVVGGRVSMAKGRTPADVDSAVASFERVERLFPGNDAVPAAGYYAGEALRLVRRHEEALTRYRRVTASYPSSPWAARANLAAGYCLVQADRAVAALPEVQRVRQMMPASSEAEAALNINSILYRLHVRAPKGPAFTFNNRFIGPDKSNFNDVIGVTIDPLNRILLGFNRGVAIFDPKGTLAQTVTAQDPSAFFVDEANRVVFAREGALHTERVSSIPITVPPTEPNKPPRVVEEIPSVVMTSTGQRLVVNKKDKTVVRYDAAGRYLGPFMPAISTDRIAINSLDDVAVIDKDAKAIAILDRDGKPLSKITTKGANYQLDEPVDVSFDRLGYLYVLDRGKGSVLVFGPRNRLITTFTIAENAPGAFMKARALGLDAAGRLYIFDEKAKRIQVYQ
jgi:TolA-binding protein